MSESALTTPNRPAMNPLRVTKRQGSNSPTNSRHRTASGASISVDGAPATTVSVTSFLKEVDDWITDIRSQLKTLESQHAKHRGAWIADVDTEDATHLTSESSTVDSEETDHTYVSSSSFDSFRSKTSLNRNGVSATKT